MDPETLMQELAAFGNAREVLTPWIAGAHALGVLRAAHAAGIIDAVRTPQTLTQIATATHLAPERAATLCEALDAHGVVIREDDQYRLAEAWTLVAAPDALTLLDDTLAGALAKVRALELAAGSNGTYWTLPSHDRVALAREVTINPAAVLVPHLMTSLIGSGAPEVDAVLAAGGRYLELGCGVGGGLLSLLRVYPTVTAVGVDIAGDVLAEAQRRAGALGVADRVELRRGDAVDLDVRDEFDVVFWSQFFFPSPSRPATLQVALRALKPGGLLMAPLLADPPETAEAFHAAEGQAYTVDRVAYSTWDVPVISAQALQEEVETAGFEFMRTIAHEFGRTLLARRPAAANNVPAPSASTH